MVHITVWSQWWCHSGGGGDGGGDGGDDVCKMDISYNENISCFNLSGSHTSAQLIDKLDIKSLPGNPWHVQATCATTGEGIYEGLNSLAKMVKEFKKTNTGRF